MSSLAPLVGVLRLQLQIIHYLRVRVKIREKSEMGAWYPLFAHARKDPLADSYHSVNSVRCAEHFYYVSCLHVIFLRVVFELYVCNRAPCWAISMNL